jgi:FkbM family methyltransferase
MKRPLLTRLLPNRFKQSLYYRYYHARHADWPGLFENASLTFAPNVAMHGLLPGDVISGNIAFNGFYELALSQRIVQLARSGTTFVDVGANMGYFSLLWAGVNPRGRVVAFEAAPRNVAILESNIARNHLADRITLVPKAAGDHSGTITFDAGPADQTGWGGISSTVTSTTIDVPLVRLDQELSDSPIDVLKIDVEGADTWVLLGCEALLKAKQIGVLFFEQHRGRMEKLGIAPGEAQTFLQDLGYTCVPFGGDDGEWTAYPNAPALIESGGAKEGGAGDRFSPPRRGQPPQLTRPCA